MLLLSTAFLGLSFQVYRFLLGQDIVQERVSFQEFLPKKLPDTTAILLNWSRRENVIHLSEQVLCSQSLSGTIATVFVWNNSPLELKDTVGNKSLSAASWSPYQF
jgi:hypothetical protein